MTEYTKEELPGAIEAILFTLGSTVEKKTLSTALGVAETDIEEAVKKLQQDYENPNVGLRILELDTAYQMCTKGKYYDALIQVAKTPTKAELTGVMMEVLSIVAYKQPVTRGEIERIRGVANDHALGKLIDYRLIEEAGRLDAPGRPILFKTTEEFLRTFGLKSVRELPPVSDALLEEAREEAYRTIGFQMDGQLEMSFDPENGGDGGPVIVET